MPEHFLPPCRMHYRSAQSAAHAPVVDPATGRVLVRNRGALRASLRANPLHQDTAAEAAWHSFTKRQAARCGASPACTSLPS